MVKLDQFCDRAASYVSQVFAITITYTPMLIYVLKVTRGRLNALLHFIIFGGCAYSTAYLIHDHFQETSKVAITIGAVVAMIWGLYCLIVALQWVVTRIRLCCLGRKYILAPKDCVESSGMLYALPSMNGEAFVVRSAGSTSVNSVLVPKTEKIILGAKLAKRSGIVNLVKHAQKGKETKK